MSPSATLDSAGRPLVRASVRRRLNLTPGSRLCLERVTERIELMPEALTRKGARLARASPSRSSPAASARKLDAATAFRLLDESVMPFVRTIALTGKDVLAALRDASTRGVCDRRVLCSSHACSWRDITPAPASRFRPHRWCATTR